MKGWGENPSGVAAERWLENVHKEMVNGINNSFKSKFPFR